MCFWKKKKAKIVIDSKYQIGDFVLFKNKKDEATSGYIYNVKQDGTGVIYDIQIGGECPAILADIPEEKVIKKK